MAPKHWLMKAEPDSRIVKGKDVKFSVDDFEAVGITPWEGVRNAEARNLMKEMKIGDKVLFYHSNCKNPGIAGFAEVSKEAYPDYTAWDPSHPYYDAKTDKENPKWYMVDVTFVSRADNFVPLALLRNIASSSEVPDEVAYIGQDGAKAIKGMALVTRGRLSVQRVEEETWKIVEKLAERGGWETGKPITGQSSKKGKSKAKSSPQYSRSKKNSNEEDAARPPASSHNPGTQKLSRKRKIEDTEPMEGNTKPRRSTRAKR